MDNNNDIIEQQQENEGSEAENVTEMDSEAAEEAAEQNTDKSEKGNILKDVVEIIESTLITVFIIVMIFTYILHPVNIVGHSMVPTLNNNYDDSREDTDKVFMTTVYFKIKNGDILVIDKMHNYLLDDNGNAYQPEPYVARPISECIIKRVIACGGQTVDIRDSKVIVDGVEIDEPYIRNGSTTEDGGAFTGQFPITVPEGYYFVMGDNRNHSTDSRFPAVGLVKKDEVYGKAIIKYAPLSEFDILTNSVTGDANKE